MTIEFISDDSPIEALCAELTARFPTNPFYTRSYVGAQRTLGLSPLAFLLRDNGQIQSGCTAFMKKGRMTHSLEITSLPVLDQRRRFLGRCDPILP